MSTKRKSSERKPPGYWTRETVREEAERVMEEHGLDELPTSTWFKNSGYESLGQQIYLKIGFYKLRLLLGGENNTKPPGYWTEETVLEEVRRVMEEHGFEELPSKIWFRENDYGYLSQQVKSKIGWLKLREIFGGNDLRRPDGYWTKETVLEEARRVMADYNLKELPSRRWFEENGFSPLAHQIKKHYGYLKLRECLGEEPRRKPKGYWTEEIVIEKVLKVIEENGLDSLPSQRWLKENGFGALAHKIGDYFTYPELREVLGGEALRRPNGYWTEETVMSEAKKIMRENNFDEFPSRNWLNRNGHSTLAVRIIKMCGFLKFREILGESPRTLDRLVETNDEARSVAELALTFPQYQQQFLDALQKRYTATSFRRTNLADYLGDFQPQVNGSIFPTLAHYAELIDIKKLDLEELFYMIAKKNYQREFNTNPEVCLQRIEEDIKQFPQLETVLQRTHDYYREVLDLDIPGVA
jgi:hypothetical protein